jgi:hypothetical protein
MEEGMKEFRELWSVPEYRRILTVMAIVFIALCIFFGTSGCGTAPEKRWTPREIDPGFHLFYMSPVTEATRVNGVIVPAWDGNRHNQVDIYECSATHARVSDEKWVPRSILLADWCDAEIYKRVK